MTSIEPSSDQAVQLRAKQFIDRVWPHWERTDEWDLGFQMAFRDFMSDIDLFERVAGPYEHGFGLGIRPRSGATHEIDFIGFHEDSIYVFELKHYPEGMIGKGIVAEFFWKVADFYLGNPVLQEREVKLFLTTLATLDDGARSACISLGITVVEPGYSSVQVLDYYTRKLKAQQELGRLVGCDDEIAELTAEMDELVEATSFSLSQLIVPTGSGVFVLNPLPPDPRRALTLFLSANQRFRRVLEVYRTQARARDSIPNGGPPR